MYKLIKRLSDFEMAHRMGKGYSGKCRNIHGHSYQLVVILQNESLDQFDMVMDFGDIKKLFDTYVQDYLDHATMVSANDISLLKFLEEDVQRHVVVDKNTNTTAEFMSKYLFTIFTELLLTSGEIQVEVKAVKIWETKGSCAVYEK